MKRISLFLILALLFASAYGIPLRIFHTNDSHGAFEPRNYWIDGSQTALGGYISLWEHLNLHRKDAPNSIYLDAGDQQTGSAFASMNYDDAIGGAVIHVFNAMNLDACTFGNHEFDQNPANLDRLVDLANYPFVSSNLIDKDTNFSLGGHPWLILEREALKIGVLGLTLVELPEKVSIENVAGLQILPYKEAIDVYLDELDSKTDLIIVLSHNGFEADSLLATILDQRVDLIIGGHTHTYLSEPTQVNGIYILQAGSNLTHLGIADIDVADDHIVSFESRLEPLTVLPTSENNPISDFMNEMSRQIEAELGIQIALLPEDWVPNKFQSTPLSRWMANALKRHYEDVFHPDLAIVNNGGFRKPIPAGPVTLRDMHELLPFNNTVTIFSCTGADLLSYDALNRLTAIKRPYDICESTAPGWVEADEGMYFDLGGQRLEPQKTYHVISHNFVAGQWDKYLGFEPFDVYDTGEMFLDAMIQEIKKEFGN